MTRKDHLRDHYKNYHFEDLGRAKKNEKMSLEERQRAEEIWQLERRIDANWWRCPHDLIRIHIAEKGFICDTCNQPCEQERITARQKNGETKEDKDYGHYTAKYWVP